MKKIIAALALTALACGFIQQPSLADNDWFDRHDRNHDQRWSRSEYRDAHRYYNRYNTNDRWNNQQINDKWNGIHNHGYVTRDQVREIRNWH